MVAEQQPLIERSRIEHKGADVVILTLNRPEQRNPLDRTTVAALRAVLEELAQAPVPDAVILTGAGETFSAGGDLKGYQDLYRDKAAFDAFLANLYAVNELLEEGPYLTVAMVNGTCVAGGLEVSLACDLVTIADTARIGDGHLRFAQLPGGGGSQRLVRAIGVQRARLWLYSARLFTAADAVAAGLASFVAPAVELRAQTLDFVADIAAFSPHARRTMKQLVNVALNNDIHTGLQRELDIVTHYATTSHDAVEGLMAFAERREPNYLGR